MNWLDWSCMWIGRVFLGVALLSFFIVCIDYMLCRVLEYCYSFEAITSFLLNRKDFQEWKKEHKARTQK